MGRRGGDPVPRVAGNRSGDAVASLVAWFNTEGVTAVVPRHGSGRQPAYSPEERGRILAEAHRAPDRERDAPPGAGNRYGLSHCLGRVRQATGRHRHGDMLPSATVLSLMNLICGFWELTRSASICSS